MAPRAAAHWRTKGSKKMRGLVLWTLRGDGEMTAREIASELNAKWTRVCAALNDLMVAGDVDHIGSGRFRRIER